MLVAACRRYTVLTTVRDDPCIVAPSRSCPRLPRYLTHIHVLDSSVHIGSALNVDTIFERQTSRFRLVCDG